uniref:Uncharacterized protein n=1 Tax=Rhizophora mucronata TaxID=61149 RepID=A0A2P2NP31_RHIMU
MINFPLSNPTRLTREREREIYREPNNTLNISSTRNQKLCSLCLLKGPADHRNSYENRFSLFLLFNSNRLCFCRSPELIYPFCKFKLYI